MQAQKYFLHFIGEEAKVLFVGLTNKLTGSL